MSYGRELPATRKALLEAARKPQAKRAIDNMRVVKDYSGSFAALGHRSFRFVLSTEAVDRAGDSVSQRGWILQNYLRNPVVLLDHGYHPVLGSLPIGRSVDTRVEGGKLKSTLVLDSSDTPVTGPYAEMVRMKLVAGSLFACSVGFQPVDFDLAERGNFDDPGLNFERQDLTEWSVVSVPCLPDALVELPSDGSFLSDLRDAVSAGKGARSPRFRSAPGTAQRRLETAEWFERRYPSR